MKGDLVFRILEKIADAGADMGELLNVMIKQSVITKHGSEEGFLQMN